MKDDAYKSLGESIEALAKKADEVLERAKQGEVFDPPVVQSKPQPAKRRKSKPQSPAAPAQDGQAKIKALQDAVHTLEEKSNRLETVVQNLRTERGHLMGRIRALRAMLEKSRHER